jgi:hypothetical protein
MEKARAIFDSGPLNKLRHDGVTVINGTLAGGDRYELLVSTIAAHLDAARAEERKAVREELRPLLHTRTIGTPDDCVPKALIQQLLRRLDEKGTA